VIFNATAGGLFRLFEGSKQILAHDKPPLSEENFVQDK